MKPKNRMLTTLLIILGGCLGALGTFQLQKFGLSPVLASCLTGLLGALIGYGLKNEDLSMVIFAGSFVGMTAVSIASLPIILIAGLACGILYWLSLPIFDGYGGKLGALAFISVSIVLFLIWVVEKKVS
jgi:hypothetical protein